MSPDARPIPRLVDLPGLTEAEQESRTFVRTLLGEAVAQERHTRRQQRLMAEAMVRLGKPVFRAGKPKRRKPTRNVRLVAEARTRSAHLRAKEPVGFEGYQNPAEWEVAA